MPASSPRATYSSRAVSTVECECVVIVVEIRREVPNESRPYSLHPDTRGATLQARQLTIIRLAGPVCIGPLGGRGGIREQVAGPRRPLLSSGGASLCTVAHRARTSPLPPGSLPHYAPQTEL